MVLTTPAISDAREKDSSCSSIRPASILERSRMSLIQGEKVPARTKHTVKRLDVLL
jgi:hypothetical protein